VRKEKSPASNTGHLLRDPGRSIAVVRDSFPGPMGAYYPQRRSMTRRPILEFLFSGFAIYARGSLEGSRDAKHDPWKARDELQM
jgi:hypothetical protein